MLLEEAMREVGDFGRFQYLLIAYLCVFVAPLRVLPLFAHIFSLLVPPHRCRLPRNVYAAINVSQENLLEMALPRDDDGHLSRCRMYDANATLSRWLAVHGSADTVDDMHSSWGDVSSELPVTTCQFGWEYDFTLFYPSVVSEMDWVCEHAWKAYVSNTAFWVATAVGVLICGNLSDRIGRVPVMIGVNVLCGAAGLYTYFTAGFVHFVVSRVFVGLVVLAISIMPFVLVVEYVAPDRRMMVLSGFQVSYPLVGAAFPWLAYYLADWRKLTLVSALPPLLAPLSTWFVPESLRWLISRGKEQRSKNILKFVAKVNGKKLSDDFMQKCQFPPPTELSGTKASSIDLLKTPNLRKNFILSLVVWTLACLVYTAGQLYAANASRNPFVMTTAVNLVDIVATIIALPLADRWGRRPTMMTAYTCAAFAYVFAVAVPRGSPVVETLVFMAARVSLTMAYNVGYLYAAEVYPTAARSQALSMRQAFGSVGKFFSSQVTQLAAYGRPIPLILMGGMSFLLAALTFPMPETLHQRLPETLDDGERFVHGQYTCCVAEKPSDAQPTARARSLSVISAASAVSVSPD
ncbi:solute carrier family 22 member 13 [Ixodes scapularis]|uniref:solute carrier family 22 member 13 n=1 Tax=Ixodes scapularis TaxID=6945 RepID=UPI001AD72B56|nr:solute carrier family 22 member 13 [Ixodes scapularis]